MYAMRERIAILASLLLLALCSGCQNARVKEFLGRYKELEPHYEQTGENRSRLIAEGPHLTPTMNLVKEYGQRAVDEAACRLNNSEFHNSPLRELCILLEASFREALPEEDRQYAKNVSKGLVDKFEALLAHREKWRSSATLSVMLLSAFPRKETVPLIRQIVQETKEFEDYHLMCAGLAYLVESWPMLSQKEREVIKSELQQFREEVTYEFGQSAVDQYLEWIGRIESEESASKKHKSK